MLWGEDGVEVEIRRCFESLKSIYQQPKKAPKRGRTRRRPRCLLPQQKNQKTQNYTI